MLKIGPKIAVPANSSRFFESPEVALSQEKAVIQLHLNETHQFVYNAMFDASLIKHDVNYCTSDVFHFEQTREYFTKLGLDKLGFSSFIEIGCGQGEFVEFLREQKYRAVGFDPVLRGSSPYLFNSYWSIENHEQKLNTLYDRNPLFIMRCVLPHIEKPFDFLDLIFEFNHEAGVLIEFQRRKWIEENHVWSNISHDHVNVFSEEDFDFKYNVIRSSTFANEEWAYILLTKKAPPQK
jgi:hypothetical protein